jgi:hypothetical protein
MRFARQAQHAYIVNKSDAIRQVFKQYGRRISNQDVMDILSLEGIQVCRQLVAGVRRILTTDKDELEGNRHLSHFKYIAKRFSKDDAIELLDTVYQELKRE